MGALPLLLVVTGRPASGKTTLAGVLSQRLRLPVVSRDALKEGMVQTVRGCASGMDEEAIARSTYEAFFETIETLLRRGISLVAEAAFQHKLWAPRLEALGEMARVRIVVCTLDAELAQRRHAGRAAADPERSSYHVDPTPGAYEPPRVGVPTLMVDTSGGYEPDLEKIVAFALGADEPGGL